MTLSMLSDHPACPFTTVDLRLFSSGLVVDRMEKAMLPLLVTFSTHVDCMWTVDIGDCVGEALRWLGYDDSVIDNSMYPEGFLVVLRLKDFEGVAASEGGNVCLQYSTADRILPSFHSCRHIAFYVPTSSRYSAVFSDALHCWRDACRMDDIPDIRGLSNHEHPMPQRVLYSLLVAVDATTDDFQTSPEMSEVLRAHLRPYPGNGYQQMRCGVYVMS